MAAHPRFDNEDALNRRRCATFELASKAESGGISSALDFLRRLV